MKVGGRITRLVVDVPAQLDSVKSLVPDEWDNQAASTAATNNIAGSFGNDDEFVL
jgi:hypothetical protein